MNTWVKVYDTLRGHPKSLKAGDRAMWLYVCGLSYANEQETDGFIDRAALPAVAPGVKAPEKLAETLVSVGYWDLTEDGWQIHDYLDVQRSADEIRARRARDAERKASARAQLSAKSPHGQELDSETTLVGVLGVEKRREEKRERAKALSSAEIEIGKATDQDRALCRLFYELGRQRNPKMRVPPKSDLSRQAAALTPMRLLRERDGQPVQDIERLIRWVFTDVSEDAVFWGTTIQAPSGLRNNFVAAWAKMTAAAAAGQGNGRGPTPVLTSADLVARDEARRAKAVAA